MTDAAAKPKNILIAANLLGICAITLFHPYIKRAQSPANEWLYLASLPIAGAALCYGLYALVFRNRARGGWPIGFLSLAWLFAISSVISPHLQRKDAAIGPVAALKAASTAVPEAWTQESTRSADKGPWLDYAPSGSRFCRDQDGIIVAVFPPGAKPGAAAADPACLRASVGSTDQL